MVFSCEFCKIFKNTYFVVYTWIKGIFTEKLSFFVTLNYHPFFIFIFLSYLVSRIYLLTCIDLYLFL